MRTRKPPSMVELSHYPIEGGIAITMPIIVVSEANLRDKWGRINRAKSQRLAVACYLSESWLPPLPVRVRMVRMGRKLLDDDNLSGAFKAVRDQIAARYGVDDGSRQHYIWHVDQELSTEVGIRIEITPLAMTQVEAKGEPA